MDRPPRIELRRYRGGPAGHRHDHHQVVVALEGRMTLEVDGRPGLVSRETAALVPHGAHHAFEACRESRFLVVDIAGAVGGPGRRATSGRADPWSVEEGAPFVAVASDVRDYLDFLGARAADGPLPTALARPAADLALELLGIGAGRAPLPPALERACRLMDARPGTPATVAGVAAAAATSPSRLHVLFREHLGTTPARWLLGRRLDAAARLLADTGRPVERIARDVGFADASAFGRAFRRATGETPSGYRGRARAERSRESRQDRR